MNNKKILSVNLSECIKPNLHRSVRDFLLSGEYTVSHKREFDAFMIEIRSGSVVLLCDRTSLEAQNIIFYKEKYIFWRKKLPLVKDEREVLLRAVRVVMENHNSLLVQEAANKIRKERDSF